MQRSFRLATREREPSLDHWAIAIHTTMALIVIVLVTLTFAALEQFAAGDQSVSAIEAASLFTDQTE
jgi:hypothetical protein